MENRREKENEFHTNISSCCLYLGLVGREFKKNKQNNNKKTKTKKQKNKRQKT